MGTEVTITRPREPSSSTRRGVTILGVPVTTFVSTLVAAILYFIVDIIMLASECPFERNVIYYFVSVTLAIVGLAAMLAIQIAYQRARFDCLSLTASLFYSGTAMLVLFQIIHSATTDLCRLKMLEFEREGNPAEYSIWFLTGVALVFQVIGHYFFG